MAKEKINIDEMKLSDEKKVEECTDEELNEVVGGVTTMIAPPWFCQYCRHLNGTIDPETSRYILYCAKCGRPKHE